MNKKLPYIDPRIRFRLALRSIECFHVFEHGTRFVTVDVPFRFMVCAGQANCFISIRADKLPRKWSYERLLEQKASLMTEMECSIEMCQISNNIVISFNASELARINRVVSVPIAV